MKLVLKKRTNGFELQNNVSESYRLMTEAATKQEYYTINEKFYAPVTKIKATIDEESIPERDVISSIESRSDVFLSDGIDHFIHLETPPTIGSTFSYSYRESYKDASFFPLIIIPNADSLESFRITIEHPENVHVVFHFFFPFDSIPCSIHTLDEETTELVAAPLGRHKRLSYYPYNAVRAVILTSLWRDSTQINPTGFKEFVDWYGKKTTLTPTLDSLHRANLADSLLAGRTPYEKLKKIYDYVRSNIRYVADERGINALVPRPPSQILTQQYGDCKDRAALVCALAHEAKLPVSMALISELPSPFTSLIHPWLFNHVICAYTDSATTLFLDPTARYCEFGNLPLTDQQTRAFILDDHHPRYEWVNRIDQQPSIELTVQCGSDSLSTGDASIVLRNDIRRKALHAIKDLTEEKLKRYLQEIVGSHFTQIRLDQFKIISDGTDALILQARADISSFMVPSTERQYVPKLPFVTIGGDVLERKTDDYPIWLGEPLMLQCRIVLRAPGWKTVPDTLRINNVSHRYAYSALSSYKENMLIFDYVYKQIDRMYGGKSRNEFLSFYADFLKQRKATFIISRK
jgi:hypothetical protein